ncbi:CDP-alcohol phosphatidyltransferase family protein [Desmospora activa]|uniref:Phosphatidylglycerophosphate synthase n=1 Tax=Desmospora activa DSM 45169 TaxID=1121389 RepID=A0A2T4Z6F3_9BACL|nr:CDP-alcohol phosphatidyltransferase family protein [Desmospora activa]PTM57478.1 phosphatidylglycerophosphate synthase [Desmospora activa DSM 45169]
MSEEKPQRFTLDDVHTTYKKKDAWWTVLLVDPVASRLIVPTANHTNITPNQLSIFSFIIGLTAVTLFYIGSYPALIAAALLYHLSFIIDCMDGKIARLKGTGSTFGMLLDISLDHIRVVLCGVALTLGQYRLTEDVTYLYLLLLFVVAYFTRHINALQLFKLRRDMRAKLRKSKRKLKRTAEFAGIVIEKPEPTPPEQEEEEADNNEQADGTQSLDSLQQKKKIDLQQEFKSKFGIYMRIRDFFLERRIRMHLFSGIEFQMFIFVVAPLFGTLIIKETIFFGTILLFAFEASILYKIWLSTKDFEREFSKIQSAVETIESTLPEDWEEQYRLQKAAAKAGQTS